MSARFIAACFVSVVEPFHNWRNQAIDLLCQGAMWISPVPDHEQTVVRRRIWQKDPPASYWIACARILPWQTSRSYRNYISSGTIIFKIIPYGYNCCACRCELYHYGYRVRFLFSFTNRYMNSFMNCLQVFSNSLEIGAIVQTESKIRNAVAGIGHYSIPGHRWRWLLSASFPDWRSGSRMPFRGCGRGCHRRWIRYDVRLYPAVGFEKRPIQLLRQSRVFPRRTKTNVVQTNKLRH